MKDILIVEDGQQDRERLEKLFSANGYSVVACESVTMAEKHLEHEKFRLAILDIGLSDKSGSLLFDSLKKRSKAGQIIIFTGNPSVHLKQRFISQGAIDYIVKASPQAQNQAFLERVQEILGTANLQAAQGMELNSFLEQYVQENSRQLFLDMDNTFPACTNCGNREYVVIFSHKPQLPPEISGQVVCTNCANPMDPEVK